MHGALHDHTNKKQKLIRALLSEFCETGAIHNEGSASGDPALVLQCHDTCAEVWNPSVTRSQVKPILGGQRGKREIQRTLSICVRVIRCCKQPSLGFKCNPRTEKSLAAACRTAQNPSCG